MLCFMLSTSKAQQSAIILVPGIGGSILDSVNRLTQERTRIWLRYTNQETLVKEQLYVKFNPSKDEAEEIDSTYDVVSPDDEFGLFSICNMNPSVQMPRLVVEPLYYFQDMRDMFESLGYVPGKTLFGFPYDWRQSCSHVPTLTKLRDLVRQVSSATKAPVDLVSHSMGGLVILLYFAAWPEDVKLVNTWITTGTPFLGTPRCFQSLILGENFQYWKIDLWTGHQLVLECPSFYDLLPVPRVWTKDPRIAVRRDDRFVVYKTVDDDLGVVREANRKNTLIIEKDGQVLPWPFNDILLNKSRANHEVMASAPVPRRFFNIIGTGKQTPFDHSFNAPITDFTQLLRQEPIVTYVDGDGTVPAESQRGDGKRSTYQHTVVSDHMSLVKNEDVLVAVRHFLGLSCSWAGKWRSSFGMIRLRQVHWTVSGVLQGKSSDFALYGQIWANKLTGAFTLHGINRSLEVVLTDDCLSMKGQWKYDFRTTGEPFEFTAKLQHQLKDCKKGTTQSCRGQHGSGTESCINGCWNACILEQCDEGFSLLENFPLGSPQCVYDPTAVVSGRGANDSSVARPWYANFLHGISVGMFVLGMVLAVLLSAVAVLLFVTAARRDRRTAMLKRRRSMRMSYMSPAIPNAEDDDSANEDTEDYTDAHLPAVRVHAISSNSSPNINTPSVTGRLPDMNSIRRFSLPGNMNFTQGQAWSQVGRQMNRLADWLKAKR